MLIQETIIRGTVDTIIFNFSVFRKLAIISLKNVYQLSNKSIICTLQEENNAKYELTDVFNFCMFGNYVCVWLLIT